MSFCLGLHCAFALWSVFLADPFGGVAPADRIVSQLNGTSLQAIYRYDIPSKVPLHGEISFPELAGKCQLYEPDLRRIIRFAIVYHRVFQERNAGFVSHSAASRRLVDFPLAMDALGAQFDEVWQGFAHVGREVLSSSTY